MNNGEIYIYADDTTIYTIGITVDEISLVLQEGMDQLQTWCLNNRLIVHEGKSESMILSIISFIGPIRPLMWVRKLSNINLPLFVSEFPLMKNYLGLNVLNQSVYHLILKLKY